MQGSDGCDEGEHVGVQTTVEASDVKREHLALQKTWNFLTFFGYFLVHFCPTRPDPADQYQCGSSTLVLSPAAGIWRMWWSYMRSLPPSKKNIQHFKTWTFLIFLLFFWSFFCDPGSGSSRPKSMRVHTNPQHWSCLLVQGSDGCDEGEHVGAVGGGAGWRQSRAPCREQTHQVYQIIFCSLDLWIRPNISTKQKYHK